MNDQIHDLSAYRCHHDGAIENVARGLDAVQQIEALGLNVAQVLAIGDDRDRAQLIAREAEPAGAADRQRAQRNERGNFRLGAFSVAEECNSPPR
jgi:hypothetical protein